MKNYEGHLFEFTIRKEVAIGILDDIKNWGGCSGDIEVNRTYLINLVDKDTAKQFYYEFDWAFEELCDLDQEDGGSWI